MPWKLCQDAASNRTVPALLVLLFNSPYAQYYNLLSANRSSYGTVSIVHVLLLLEEDERVLGRVWEMLRLSLLWLVVEMQFFSENPS